MCFLFVINLILLKMSRYQQLCQFIININYVEKEKTETKGNCFRCDDGKQYSIFKRKLTW